MDAAKNSFDHFFIEFYAVIKKLNAIRTARSNADWQLSLPYWLSISSNFISWLLKTVCVFAHHTCETINKSSKSKFLLYRL